MCRAQFNPFHVLNHVPGIAFHKGSPFKPSLCRGTTCTTYCVSQLAQPQGLNHVWSNAQPVPTQSHPNSGTLTFSLGLKSEAKPNIDRFLHLIHPTIGQQMSALILGRILNIFILDEIYQRATSFSSSSSSPFSSIFFLIAAFASDNLSFFLWVTWQRSEDQPRDNQDVSSVFV